MKDYHGGQKDYLPNFFSRRIILGNSMFYVYARALLGESILDYLTGIQERKKSTKINFLGPETARWGGGLPREGAVAEKFVVPSLESLSSLGFQERNLGRPGNFAGMSRTLGCVQKVCPKKVRAHFSFPI